MHLLLAHGAVIGQLTALGKTALHLALEAQRDGNVRQLLASAGGPDLVMVQGRPKQLASTTRLEYMP